MKMKMDSIFDGAKFGDKFITRDCRVAIFMGYNERYGDNYLLVIPSIPEEECNIYADILNNADGSSCMNDSNYDIVSRYQEPIDEDELEKLAKEYEMKNLKLDDRGTAYEVVGSSKKAYKAGYRKAKEE